MIKIFILAIGFLSAPGCYGQTPVDVAESTLKVGILGEEIFYFGFAEGDKLIFNFEEVNGKELKELDYEYKTVKGEIMFRSKQSELSKTVAPMGLKESKEPPFKLVDSLKTVKE